MTDMPRLRLIAGLLTLTLALGACGGNGGDDATPEAAASTQRTSESASPQQSPSASESPSASASSSASSATGSASSSAAGTASSSSSVEESDAATASAESSDASAEGDPGETDAEDASSDSAAPTDDPVTVDSAVVPPTKDLGGPQAGVAPGDTPVAIRQPAPAPVVQKVPIEHVRPATPAPATSEPTGTSDAPSTRPSAAPSVPTATRPPTTPTTTPSTPTHAEPVPVRQVNCRVTRCIALTFDDGPGRHTGRLLDVLAAEDVPATFYVLGQSASINPALIARMGAEGHQVGNHTWSHPNLTTQSPVQVRDEIQRADAAIRAGGVTPSTVRAPYGALNESVLSAFGGLNRAGSVTWSVDTRDWEHRTPSMTLENVKAQAGAGGIVLMHDVHSTTVDAVPSVIRWLRAQGYTFVTVDTITGGVGSGGSVGRGLHP